MKPWVKAGLFFSIWMFVFTTFIAPYIYIGIGTQDESEPKFTLVKIIINALASIGAGFWIGYSNKKKAPKKQIDA